MRFLPGPATRAAVARHPFVLAGFAVVLLLGVVAAVLVVIDSARGGDTAGPQVDIEPQGTATAGPIARTAVALGVAGTTNTTTAVRAAPGARSRVFGTVPRGTLLQIDGRTDENKWLRVIYPVDSELHGWVSADDLDITGSLLSVIVATPEPPIYVDVPTTDPAFLTPETTETPESTCTPESEETAEEDCPPEGTPTPSGLPDLVVGTSPVLSDSILFITVVNQGDAAFEGDLVVAVFNVDGTELLAGATVPGFTLDPGESIDVGTGYAVTENQSLLLVVDPNGEVDEIDNANNQITVSISVGDPPPEETPAE